MQTTVPKQNFISALLFKKNNNMTYIREKLLRRSLKKGRNMFTLVFFLQVCDPRVSLEAKKSEHKCTFMQPPFAIFAYIPVSNFVQRLSFISLIL